MVKIVDKVVNSKPVQGIENWVRWAGVRKVSFLTGMIATGAALQKSGVGGKFLEMIQEQPISTAVVGAGVGAILYGTGREARTLEFTEKRSFTVSPTRSLIGGIALGVAGAAWAGYNIYSESNNTAVAGTRSEFTFETSEEGLCEVDNVGNSYNAQLVQLVLKNRGYYGGPLDGIFGGDSIEALRAFQLDKEIAVDGIYGLETCYEIEEFVDNNPNTPLGNSN